MRSKLTVVLFFVGVLSLYGGAAMLKEAPTRSYADYEGLQQVEARRMDAAFVRPGVKFGAYTALLLEEPELAFRTPDRSKQQFPLTEQQKTQFRDLLAQVFSAELENSEQLRLVDQPGPDVLRLGVRVQDITATIPPRGVGSVGRASIALDAVGEATLVLELRDSQSEETLVRAFDSRAVEGIAIFQKGVPLTSWSDVERLCERWATIARRGLDDLVGDG